MPSWISSTGTPHDGFICPPYLLIRSTRSRGVLDDLACDADVVLEVRRRLAVGEQRPVHHHTREAQLDGADARLGAVAMVLVQGHGDLRIQLLRRLHEMEEEAVVGVGTRAARG